jgi:hypothetical protein
VGIENVAIGDSGEDLASAFLKRYFSIWPLRPDLGMDLTGYYRRSSTPVSIAFQVKNAHRFTFRSSILASWLASIDRQPVILFRVETLSSRSQRYSFKVLHEWMLDNPDWHHRLKKQKSLSISLDEFDDIGDDDQNFLSAVEAEVSRVIGDGLSLWTARHWRGLPISEPEIYSHFGRLGRLELDASTLDEMAKVRAPSWQEGQWWKIRDALGGPSTVPWGSLAKRREQLKSNVAPSEVNGEMAAFQEFVAAMRSFSRGDTFQIPRTSWRNIYPWRVFCQMFPMSLEMLDAFLRQPMGRAASQLSLGTAFILVATLANSEDSVLAERAREILARVGNDCLVQRVVSYEQYRVVANYYAACCEAGSALEARRCLDFHRRHPEEWQISWQRAYYGGDDLTSARAAFHKLTQPNLRQLKTQNLEEWRLALLKRRGVRLPKDLTLLQRPK